MDRNGILLIPITGFLESLSARRAWIEIMDDFEPSTTRKVALRKESVDRNKIRIAAINGIIESLSARRAWIEIITHTARNTSIASLSARRAWIEIPVSISDSALVRRRSPQGERG